VLYTVSHRWHATDPDHKQPWPRRTRARLVPRRHPPGIPRLSQRRLRSDRSQLRRHRRGDNPGTRRRGRPGLASAATQRLAAEVHGVSWAGARTYPPRGCCALGGVAGSPVVFAVTFIVVNARIRSGSDRR
jgi:hypothetical protein